MAQAAGKRNKTGKDASHSANAELYAASMKPTSTVAMGLKSTHTASQCWREQVRREGELAHVWRLKHNRVDEIDAAEREAVQNTLARAAARHAAYHDATHNRELYDILYSADNSYNDMSSRGGGGGGAWQAAAAAPSAAASRLATTTSAAIGAHAATASSSLSSSSTGATSAAAATTSSAAGGGAVACPPPRELLHGPRNTQRYLHARATAHTLHERYDDQDGPVTSAQVIGWEATTAAATPLLTSVTQRHTIRRSHTGAYHTPVDDEHAALFGYRLTAH